MEEFSAQPILLLTIITLWIDIGNTVDSVYFDEDKPCIAINPSIFSH
jgi:hypothetical protein